VFDHESPPPRPPSRKHCISRELPQLSESPPRAELLPEGERKLIYDHYMDAIANYYGIPDYY